MKSILREVTPLSTGDCFMISFNTVSDFSYPVHIHPEYELVFIENAKGAKRIIGENTEEIGELELVLITNSELKHGWTKNICRNEMINEIIIRFNHSLLTETLLTKNLFFPLKDMFEKASRGITFSEDTIRKIKHRIYDLTEKKEGGHTVFNLFSLLYDLSLSESIRILSGCATSELHNLDNKRIEMVYKYMHDNYEREVHLQDIANLVGMTEVALSRFLKKKTGRNFIDAINDIRLGYAIRLLNETTLSISDICYKCGFHNLSNFNRIFKKKKGYTPSEYRESVPVTKHFF